MLPALPGTGPGPGWPRGLAGTQRCGGCPFSAVAVCEAPRDGPAGLSLATSTQRPRMDLCHVPPTREKGWYLALMAPNVKGPNYAWLDPSRLYCHPQGLQDCVADLLQPFQGDPIDMVAGIDAMGFILGAAAAAVLQKGFLAIRKAGHLCVQTVSQPYTDYSGREKVMEVCASSSWTSGWKPGAPCERPSSWWSSWGESWQVWPPSASRAARAGGGSGSITSVPTACPPACSPASTATSSARSDGGLAPPPPCPPAGLPAIWDRDTRSIPHPLWLSLYPRCSPLRGGSHPPLAPSSHQPASLGGLCQGAGGVTAVSSLTPFLKSIKKVLLRKTGAQGHLPLQAVPGFA
ncbi:PREDICTED: uncharacterized protein LOC106894430 isoform X1 [Calidris pugnax]|uniref:uncharacterized protein LOC106894430 isoform X1 n=1 Tax=Calidris pugnax TaxID=198806 RepID=UPI00071D0BB0|nr:PREDICTED: uncharacterized protein LOC106894430 isoform X1 [Calidris pugnax]